MLIDLHCHSNVHSGCSSLTPGELARLARAAGLDGICLTEHDRTWSEAEARALSAEHDFVILRGMEVTTELGHVLVFGLDAPAADMYFAAALRRRVLEAGGLMLLAHPARPGQPAVDLATHGQLFDGVEGRNGSDTAAQNAAAARLGAVLPLPPIGGSDCHSPREVGTAATYLVRPVASECALIAELRRGRHAAVAPRDIRAAK